MLPIIVNAYNRPASLARLLASIGSAEVPAGTPLIISIDHGGDADVLQVAETFGWARGPKEIIAQPRKLGLVGHFRFCGGLTRQWGALICLEDDLVVSRQFHNFAAQALAVCGDDPRLAGISLNRPWFNGYTHTPFEPVLDDADNFFFQVYWYQGQVYTPEMWDAFESWWRGSPGGVTPQDGLHPMFLPGPRWGNDFFPKGMQYLAATGKTFLYPRESHTTNFGDAGTHFGQATPFFQVPLQHFRETYRLRGLDSARGVYDSFYELAPDKLAPALGETAFDVDLNGTKPAEALRHDLVLTTRPVRRAVRTFGDALRPLEMNVLEGTPGSGIALARREDVREGWLDNLRFERRRHAWYARREIPLRRRLLYRLLERLDRGR